MSLGVQAIKDTRQNMVVAATVMATTFIEDLRAANVLHFDLNMSTRRMVVTFSETMARDTVRPSQFALQSKASADGTEQMFALTEGSVGPGDSTQITFDLSVGNTNAIKALSDLARSASTTYLLMQAGAVEDKNGVSALAINGAAALAVRNYVSDTVAPRLVDYRVNMNDGTLTLSFDETVSRASLTLVKVTLQSSQVSPAQTLVPSGAAVTAPSPTVLVLQLTSTELNAVKRMASLMMGASSSFVRLASGAVKDAFGNDIQDAVLGASDYQADVTAPVLSSFSFTLDGGGTLVLRFSEAMSIGTLRVAGLTLQDSAGPTSALHSLSGTHRRGECLNNEGTDVSIFLTKTDADTIKALGICSAVTNCYLTTANDTIADWVGLFAGGIAQGSGMRTSTSGQDTTLVTMEQFSNL